MPCTRTINVFKSKATDLTVSQPGKLLINHIRDMKQRRTHVLVISSRGLERNVHHYQFLHYLINL
jgi:hypothetical protein